MNFVIMPLVFLSSMIIATKAMPDWIAAVARYNPVDWAVQMARGAALGGDWSLVAQYGAQLALFSAVCILLAVRAFHRFMDKA